MELIRKKLDSIVEQHAVLARPFLANCVSITPLILLTLFLPNVLVPILVLLTIPVLYKVSAAYQPALFLMNRTQAHWYVVIPTQCLLILCGLLLMKCGKIVLFFPVVCVFFLLILCSIAPVLRFKYHRQTPRFQYRIIFIICSSIVATAQIINFIKWI